MYIYIYDYKFYLYMYTCILLHSLNSLSFFQALVSLQSDLSVSWSFVMGPFQNPTVTVVLQGKWWIWGTVHSTWQQQAAALNQVWIQGPKNMTCPLEKATLLEEVELCWWPSQGCHHLVVSQRSDVKQSPLKNDQPFTAKKNYGSLLSHVWSPISLCFSMILWDLLVPQ